MREEKNGANRRVQEFIPSSLAAEPVNGDAQPIL